jgi:hypothetical protein
MTETRLVLRILVLAALVIALICAATPRTILGADWDTWTVGALLGWALEPLLTVRAA